MKIVLDNLIENFIKDLDCQKLPKELDIVLEGGAFNGIYEMGIMMYIKQLEKLKKIKVRRISGTSVGAILGLAYTLDRLYLFNEISNKLLQSFKENYNLFELREMLYDIENTSMKIDDYKLFQNKFYLTYFDSKKRKQIVKKKYKSNKDLINQIIKSTYVPFLMDGNVSYKGSIDGGYPYIFKKRENNKYRKTLYISITSFKYINDILSVKNEKNGHIRLFDGITDINRFFSTNNRSEFCSYVENWNVYDFIYIRIKEVIFVLILTLLNIILKVIEIIPDSVKDYKYSIWITKIISNLSYDIISRIMN